MGWNHPDISLDEMMKLIKGFVDILILASGYQSSGLLAHWDSDNINRAFQWALFFENVFRRLSCLDVYQESIVELDAALFEMTSHPAFPQGLAQLSSATLRRARSFLLEHLLHTLPLRDSHLQAVLTAIIEVDLSDPSQTEHDCLNAYLNDLTLQNRICMRDNSTFSDVTPTLETENFTKLAVHELFGRQSSVSCILIIEEGVNVLSNAVKNNGWKDSDCSLYGEPMNHEIVPTLLPIADELVDFVTWKQWKSRALSYFLDKRTIRLVSGASLIFSGANEQWRKIFGQLNISEKSSENDLYETIEGGILDYLTRLLGGQIHLLWKSSPALAAVSLTFWPTLFRVYLSEIELQFKGKPSMIRFGIYAAIVFKIAMSTRTEPKMAIYQKSHKINLAVSRWPYSIVPSRVEKALLNNQSKT
ncbi:Detected protein of unknown function [Hibiscus syriacus]|uniref:Uncharacterized protein n=1 Tax=Hibiscus syriacus TaxID=106335 RepID=A0A6A2XVT3_HIBSY|nr:Detected protein of unknown function [Hibiscus syriacus]